MNNERIYKISEQIQNHMMDISKLIGELKGIKIEQFEPERKKAGKAWRASIKEEYFTLLSVGSIHKSFEMSSREDDYRYSTGNYFRTEEETEAHKRHIMAVGAWNRIANEYPSGQYVIISDSEFGADLDAMKFFPFRRIDTKSNIDEAIERFKKEGEAHGFTVDDLLLYANEVRHA